MNESYFPHLKISFEPYGVVSGSLKSAAPSRTPVGSMRGRRNNRRGINVVNP